MHTTCFLYLLFKFLHILAASVWIGSGVTLSVLNAKLVPAGDRGALDAARQSRLVGARVMGPSAGLTLIAGIITAVVSGIGFPAWVLRGMVVAVLSAALGGTVLRRSSEGLIQLLAGKGPTDPGVAPLRRRLLTFSALVLLLQISAMWAMVFKPVL